MFLKITTLLIAIFFIGCGGSKNYVSEFPPTEQEESFKNLKLYKFRLNSVNHQLRYEMDTIDPIEYSVIPHYFNFNSNDYTINTNDKQTFLKGTRGALSNITYSLNKKEAIVATLNNHPIFELSLLSSKSIKRDRLEEYKSKISMEGKEYHIKQHYLNNFYIIKNLKESETFDSLNDFRKKYQYKPFTDNLYFGLVFADDGKLQEQNSTNEYVDAGHYEIKTMDNQEVLLVYPDNLNRYSNHCYLLDFSRVWESECHLKGETREIKFYDKEVYDDVLNYMQTNFVNVDISS